MYLFAREFFICHNLHYFLCTSQNLQQIDNFKDANTILACDETTASVYGVLKNMLRSKGRPLPENDIWIAAVAIQHGLTLVSRDAHFDELETLQRVTW